MIDYQTYEKALFDWLMQRHEENPEFTFSTRIKGSKGSELDYFIGTEKSGYFGFTLWNIPVSFPGSAGDVIDIFCGYTPNGISYYIQFVQTESPKDLQNELVLKFLKSLKPRIDELGTYKYESKPGNSMFKYELQSPKENYTSIEELLSDLNNTINQLTPIIDKEISSFKALNPEFQAHRITKDEFDSYFMENVNRRKEKYENLEYYEDLEVDFKQFLEKFEKQDLDAYLDFLREIGQFFALKSGDERLVFNVHSRRGHLSFTIGQRYCLTLRKKQSDGDFGFISTKALSNESEQFKGSNPRPWFTYQHGVHISKEMKESIFDAIKFELERSEKSGYRKFNKPEFEELILGKQPSLLQEQIQKTMNNIPLNQILFGPPGTGKTYHLKENYFPQYTTQETSLSAEQHFNNVVSECSWWQVIAIALIEDGRSKVSTIADNKWVKTKAALSNSNTIRPTIWGQLQSHTVESCPFVNVKAKQQPFIFNKTEDAFWEIITEEVREHVPELYDIIASVNHFNPSPDKQIERFAFITFHQSYSYEDFIEGIKPKMANDDSDEHLVYHIEDGVFKQLCKKAEMDPENRYAIFIDEINRGNVSAIFGELITLIETDKRKGATNELVTTLPYSKKPFSVPNNIDIIGTMNTADRSVEALDTALRRRFSFVEMLPDASKLNGKEIQGINLELLLNTMNERIEVLVDRDHTIGHAFFMNTENVHDLRTAFGNKIIPLLQEYFYGNYQKMEMVIGSAFFKITEANKVKFAVKTEDFDADGKVYHILDVTNSEVVTEEAFIVALSQLIQGV